MLHFRWHNNVGGHASQQLPFNRFRRDSQTEGSHCFLDVSVPHICLPTCLLPSFSLLNTDNTCMLDYQVDAARDKLYVDVGKWRNYLSWQTSNVKSQNSTFIRIPTVTFYFLNNNASSEPVSCPPVYISDLPCSSHIGFWGGLVPENALNPSKLESLLNAGVLGLKVCFSTSTTGFIISGSHYCLPLFLLSISKQANTRRRKLTLLFSSLLCAPLVSTTSP